MMLSELCTRLVDPLGLTMPEFAEVQRRLREQSGELHDVDEFTAFNPDVLKGKTGPKGGTEADPLNVGLLLVGVMNNSPRRETAETAWRTWHFYQEGSVLAEWVGESNFKLARCPLTGAHLFGDAFRAILSMPSLAKSVQDVRVGEASAEIRYLAKQKRFARAANATSKVSKFEQKGVKRSFLRREAILDGRVIRMVAALLNSEAS